MAYVRLPMRLLLIAALSLPVTTFAQDAPAPAGATQAADANVAQHWADFNHYVLVARPDLARSAAENLINTADSAVLLRAVEQSDYADPRGTFERARRIEGLAEVAAQLEARIQSARIDVAREPERIARDIQALAEGGRPFRNAVGRLRAAGQFAAPQMLQTLQDANQARLHPYVMSAMVQIGQPIVQPLAEALPYLQPAPMAQVAQVLAEIGYPMPALPYLKRVTEASDTDPTARAAVQRAYDILAGRSDLPQGLSAAELYLVLGENRYAQATAGQQIPGLDPSQEAGILWQYSQQAGLVPVPVPAQIYGDVLAMRAAREALSLNPNLDAALSLYLTANLRRENLLPDGATDPSYPATAEPASFYATVAGPAFLQNVLARALRDGDAVLALDAIEGLQQTAGTAALIAQGDAQQPLLRALSYPDARVRFHAAEALANARPRQDFAGSQRVVPVLAEAVRPIDTRYALVVSGSQDRLNELQAAVGDQGYETFGGLSYDAVRSEVNERPAVELIVVDLEAGRLGDLLRATASDYKLGSTPIIAVVSPDRQAVIRETFPNESRITTAVVSNDPQTLATAIETALASSSGGPISDEEATEMALRALTLLRDVAIGQSIYNVADAQGPLVAALDDERPEIVAGAAQVLALINDEAAQQAIADAALEGSDDLQVQLLDSLAASATNYGNKLPRETTDRLLELVRDSEGETALAAGRAHGALSLPASNAVQLIMQ